MNILKKIDRVRHKKHKAHNFKKYLAAALVLLAVLASFYLWARAENISMPWQAASSDASQYKNDAALIKTLKEYIIQKEGHTSKYGKVFVSIDLFGVEKNGNNLDAYLWALIQEYSTSNGELSQGAGSSLPMKITLKTQGRSYLPAAYSIPRDGTFYSKDIKKIFPAKYRGFVSKREGNVEELGQENRKAAQEYFKPIIKNPDMSLSPELEQVYAAFSKSKNDEDLIGLDPYDIFRLYFHADMTGDYETEYALYFNDGKWLIPPLQDYLNEMSRTKDEPTLNYLKAIKEDIKSVYLEYGGESFDFGRYECRACIVITFTDKAPKPYNDGMPNPLAAIKGSNGIWKVQWLPAQC